MKAVTRFAPSPTGYIHIGNVRSTIYPYLIAKQQGEEGYFLSSTLEMTHYIHFLSFDSLNPHFGIRTRYYGVGVRPVCP